MKCHDLVSRVNQTSRGISLELQDYHNFQQCNKLYRRAIQDIALSIVCLTPTRNATEFLVNCK